MIYFLFLLVITILMYLGFGVIADLTESDIAEEKEAEENVLLLHKLIKNKKYYFRATYIVTNLLHAFLSIVLYFEFYKWMENRITSTLLTVAAFLPIVFFCIYLPEKIGRIYGQKLCRRDTEEEILSMVNEGQEMGVIESNEALMISNIFEFGDKVAKDIMINRSNMLALDSMATLEDAIDFMLCSQYSRYPVYDESVDSIVGILYLKDALRLHSKDNLMNKPVKSIRKLLRKPVYIPETKKIDDIFKIMQTQKVQLAIVINEYGQTAGLISMEDILEEIVGNIMDEYDVDEHHIRKKGIDEYVIDGLTKLEELEDILDIEFHTEFETINGFLISKMEHIPCDNEKFECEYEGYHFTVLKAKDKMIKSVLVVKISEPDEELEKTTIEDEVK